MSGSNLLFVGGCPRSGTALAMYLLNLHPDCDLLGEIHPSVTELTEMSRRARPGQLVGDKSPQYSRTWPSLRSAFPSCKLILTYRDFDATTASIMRQVWAPPTQEWCENDLRERLAIMADCPRCLRVQLEELEADPQPLIVEMLEYAGLSLAKYDFALGVDVVHNGDVNRSKTNG